MSVQKTVLFSTAIGVFLGGLAAALLGMSIPHPPLTYIAVGLMIGGAAGLIGAIFDN